MPNTIERGADAIAAAIEDRYRAGETDYWLSPLIVTNHREPVGRVRPGDVIIMCCRRGEREVQLTRAFADPTFNEFPRLDLEPLLFVPLTLYHPDLRHLPTAFAPQDIPATLGEVVAGRKLSQIRAAEVEKYAHITYFLSGGRAQPFPSEIDVRVLSSLNEPLVALNDLVTQLQTAWSQVDPAFVAVNVASGDILGHSLDLEPKVACANAVDRALGRLLDLAASKHCWSVITADHGLLEDHGPAGGPPNNSHTTNPVPCIVCGPQGERPTLKVHGALADVAPTVLSLMGFPAPQAMTGNLLLEQSPQTTRAVLLIILDGWGLAAPGRVNPIALAHTPYWDQLQRGPMSQLQASGEAVGLLPGRKGNSEAGHLNIGAGRVVLQDEVRIEQAIANGTFAKAPALQDAMVTARSRGAALHLVGLLSYQSSHGSIEYVIELLKAARRRHLRQIYVHIITDGRSTEPGTAPALLRELATRIARISVGTVVTAMGRGLALDRGGDYVGKTQRAYRALVHGEGIAVEV